MLSFLFRSPPLVHDAVAGRYVVGVIDDNVCGCQRRPREYS
jgi:hypothetical protein